MNVKNGEAMLLQAMRVVVEIYKAIHPDGDYISCCWLKNELGEYINIGNADDKKVKIEVFSKEG